MSEGKRNKKYSSKKEPKRPVILSKRESTSRDDKSSRKNQSDEKMQPKILLKVKEKEPAPAPITIATRENQEATPSAQASTSISIQTKERDPVPSSSTQTIIHETQPPVVPQMTRPVSLISNALYQINPNVQKLLMKSNTDFFVVGVIGTQCVGKSMIMNLLAYEELPTNIYQQLFKQKEGTFSMKSKTGKPTCAPHTESVQMYITKDRMILLDCPPVLCNPYRKDYTTSELDDMKMLIFLMSACHLVIVVQCNDFNLSLIRLIQFSELTKPTPENNNYVADYLPNVMFVKNNGLRLDFQTEEKKKREKLLKWCFAQSDLKIFIGETDKQKKEKQTDADKAVNYFVFPRVVDEELKAYHPNLESIVTDLRNRVFMSPRNQMYNGNAEFTEGLWFELISSVTANKSNFFLTTYEEVKRNHNSSSSDQPSKSSSMSFTDAD